MDVKTGIRAGLFLLAAVIAGSLGIFDAHFLYGFWIVLIVDALTFLITVIYEIMTHDRRNRQR